MATFCSAYKEGNKGAPVRRGRLPKDGAFARKGARLPKDGACPKGCAYYQFGTRERQKPPPLLLSVLLIPAIKKNEACIFAAALDGRGRQGYNKGVMCGDGMRLRAGGDPAGAGARGALWRYCGRCLRKILPKAGKYRFPYGEKRVIIDTGGECLKFRRRQYYISERTQYVNIDRRHQLGRRRKG